MTEVMAANLVLFPSENRADANKLAYIGRNPKQERRDPDSWFTPAEYLDSVRAVMGGIDLDPFSSEQANKTVGAAHIMTIDKSAFENEWNVVDKCRVFMNPPYSVGMCSRAVGRFIQQYEMKNFSQGIVLVNNATDTRWFNLLVSRCSAICFTDHRISFWNSDGKNVSGNTRGQAFFYFGRKKAAFRKLFRRHGFILMPAN